MEWLDRRLLGQLKRDSQFHLPTEPLLPYSESLISCRWATAAESLQLLSLWQISGIRGGSKVFLGLSVADTTMAAYGRPGPLQATLLTTNFSVSPGLGVYGKVNEALCLCLSTQKQNTLPSGTHCTRSWDSVVHGHCPGTWQL